MAEIVLGIGTSHGAMLGLEPDGWEVLRQRDMANRHFFKNENLSYAELEQIRLSEKLDCFLTDAETSSRYKRCWAALKTLKAILKQAKPDAVIILGNDQMESFSSSIPQFAVHWGKTIENGPIAALRPRQALYAPPERVSYPGHPDLALHIIETLKADDFDPAAISETPLQQNGERVIPHAYGFVLHQLMTDLPPPSVPVYLNTFYPPAQPSVQRCLDFGKSITRAIRSWAGQDRIAIIASGGLSHFVVDEDIDQYIIESLLHHQPERLLNIDERTFQAGTSETKNWIPLATAMRDARFKMTLVDYVPCYRSKAGTGQGMTFAYWLP